MSWQKEPPTEPGIYWYNYHGQIYVCQIWVEQEQLESVLLGSRLFFMKQPKDRKGFWFIPALQPPDEKPIVE